MNWHPPASLAAFQSARTALDGSFEFYASPGTYYLDSFVAGARLMDHFEIAHERERKVDLHSEKYSDEPPKIVRGKVVRADKPEEAVANATLLRRPESDEQALNSWDRGTSDNQGRFECAESKEDDWIYARTADGKRASIVIIKPTQLDVTLTLGPAASAKGRLVDAQGQPMAGKTLEYGVLIANWNPHFGGKITTDENGNYKLEALVPGYEYRVSLVTQTDEHGTTRSSETLFNIKPDAPGEKDSGDVAASQPSRNFAATRP